LWLGAAREGVGVKATLAVLGRLALLFGLWAPSFGGSERRCSGFHHLYGATVQSKDSHASNNADTSMRYRIDDTVNDKTEGLKH
jgi:hypothetical protein